ncbi:MAG: class I SAM-dependent methyltransferase [Bacteroidales bacterium]|nr:class I SAM-dependent methyltransferase [Bacteroidales bacterium]MCF8457060.1 class I SAM-dependent methyltransferase [Bacteroidales bacterium]
MKFYESISDLYDSIFPLNPTQIAFVKNSIGATEECSLLDIGCGTGNLSIELARISKRVVGVDLDESMLRKAEEKCDSQPNLYFSKLDMLDIGSCYPKDSFDAVICFGNTLVHLKSNNDVSGFFQQSKNLLKPTGKLLVQIINYDWIIDHGIDHLPTIENEMLKFERNYTYHPNTKLIDFDTILTVKESGQQIRNRVGLLPIRKAEIERLLEEAGFSTIKFYGNFNRDELCSDSIPLVIEAGK